MRIALVTGGQPRFTPDFNLLMHQLQGFESADLYMTLWKTDWASTEQEARSKIEKILLPNYRLAKIEIIDEPLYEYPPHSIQLSPPREQNTAWWYRRLYMQCVSLSKAFDLIDQEYDAVVRFRLDASLDKYVDIGSLDIQKSFLIFPNNGKAGFDDFKINDQFAIGTQEGMKFYCSIGKQIKELVYESDPQWARADEVDGTKYFWGFEHILGHYMKKHNVPQVCGDFGIVLSRFGRSRFTDKHYHLPVVSDPTS